MNLAGISNMRAFFTKMALEGHIIQIDMTDIRKLTSIFGIASKNLNQIAHRVNETGNIYHEDITDLQEHYKGIWVSINEILEKFVKIM